ncbi:hypothetical protein GCK32_019808 [Trichostrongylus colubriformis]|uniref:Uncharacterized protein n=1 Tax=Trichostrongylus colubriformis TaxID=6319 RepID=A0AAN8F3C3_TRICO
MSYCCVAFIVYYAYYSKLEKVQRRYGDEFITMPLRQTHEFFKNYVIKRIHFQWPNGLSTLRAPSETCSSSRRLEDFHRHRSRKTNVSSKVKKIED